MGGAEKSLVSLLKALDSSRVDVDLFLFESGGVLQSEVPSWVNILEADLVTRGMTLELRNYLWDVIKARHIGAAVSRVWMTVRSRISTKPKFSWSLVEKYIPKLNKHYDVAIGYLEGFTDFFVLDKVNAEKKIGWIHIDMTNREMPAEEVAYYERFDEIATISEVCRAAFVKHVPAAAGKIHIVENIVLPQDVINKAGKEIPRTWDPEKTHLVTVGRLDYQKGIDVAAQACKVLKDRGVAVCWHVYGKGVMHDTIMQYIEESNLAEHFVLEGLAANPYPYMKYADLVIQPSRWEGKSIVLDEAKILGKAIVVTDYPSVRDQITDGVTGMITGMTPEAIADGIEELIQNPELKTQLEQNAAREPNSSIRALDAFYNMIEA
jgi:glycosyltransferase involved in cell wall biosynthesis